MLEICADPLWRSTSSARGLPSLSVPDGSRDGVAVKELKLSCYNIGNIGFGDLGCLGFRVWGFRN